MDQVKPQISMWFVAAWFAASTTTLIFSVVLTLYLSKVSVLKPVNQNFKLYAALPKGGFLVSDNISLTDARSKIIENFFKGYQSPLADKADSFVKVADKYDLDWRLLPSIAMQESNGGKKVVKNSHNPFGFGIWGNLVVRFAGWEEAIERVGRSLREDYLNQGLTTPYQIMTKYTPPAVLKGGNWAIGVNSFMEELR